jgi:aarF domain-containing kinase
MTAVLTRFNTFFIIQELDYENEAQNQLLFQREFSQRGLDHKVKIPHVFLDYTTRRVICTEWIDGVPLARSSTDTIQRLIPVGVELFLTQLLDIGIFHADPHGRSTDWLR